MLITNRYIALVALFFSAVSVCQSETPIHSFALKDVQILDGPFKHARELNRAELLKYDPDRLLAPFRIEAGLEPKAERYGNWESTGLDGHTAGHYLTALAQYATHGDAEMQKRLEYMIGELAECQKANGNGYIGGVPNGKELWVQIAQGNLGEIRRRWVPWYNLHKTYAGLVDAWRLCGNAQAKEVLIGFADWANDLCSHLTDQQMQRMLGTEYGGMNEALADVAEITGEEKYLVLAKRFSHRTLLVPLSNGQDRLNGMHANTQVPKVIGFRRIADFAGSEEEYAAAARFFWETVVYNRSLAFGGNSMREHFPNKDQAQEWLEHREGPESCNTYNMLKLTRELFEADPQARYADFYERAMYNHILSTQHPEHGGYVYFTPARPRHYRVYSKAGLAFWCCVGSGMENHGKYEQAIYFHDENTAYVNLFIPSKLDWRNKGISIEQKTDFPRENKINLVVQTDQPKKFAIQLRHPGWVPDNAFQVSLNGEPVKRESKSSSYFTLEREWRDGDKVEAEFPMELRFEPMPNLEEYVAILYGPILLAAKTSRDDLQGLIADDSRWAHVAHGPLKPIDQAPMLVGERAEVLKQLRKVENRPLTFTAADAIFPDQFDQLELIPFYQLHDARYMIYWRSVTPEQYQQVLKNIEEKERLKIALDRRTVDRVAPGEQQPEADHNLQSENSRTGDYNGVFYREAEDGWYSYELKVKSGAPQDLMVTYWGDESQRRTFDILVDGEKLATENISRKWRKQEFVDVTYPLNDAMLAGKTKVTVKFQAHPDNHAGSIFGLRIVERE